MNLLQGDEAARVIAAQEREARKGENIGAIVGVLIALGSGWLYATTGSRAQGVFFAFLMAGLIIGAIEAAIKRQTAQLRAIEARCRIIEQAQDDARYTLAQIETAQYRK